MLIHFTPLISFYTPLKHQKTRDYLFSGDVERDCGMKWVNLKQLKEIGHEYFLVIIRPFTKKREREFALSACVLL